MKSLSEDDLAFICLCVADLVYVMNILICEKTL